MYAETEQMFPYFQSFPQEVLQFDEYGCSQKTNACSGIPISDFNLWGEGDLFKAPEPVVEEPVMGLDPMTVAISMISCGEDVISPQSLSVSVMESSIESGQILSEVFYECRKDLLAKEGNETPLSEVLNIKLPNEKTNQQHSTADEMLIAEGSFQKSASSSCLKSMENALDAPVTPNFLDFPLPDFGAAYRIRRAFSEGDIKTLNNNGNTSLLRSALGQPSSTSITCTSEERREKLSRYRSKKSKRNFGRKIKYACRKALADNQPRVRGRFAKTEETWRKEAMREKEQA